jgi:N-acetylmuramoyl-L-alanine amidase
MRNLSRSISAFLFFSFAVAIISGCAGYRRPAVEPGPVPLSLDVVYPRIANEDTIFTVRRVDSTFALGSVHPNDAKVFVNGVPAVVCENGAFLAWFRLDTVSMTYQVAAYAPDGGRTATSIPFIFWDQIPFEQNFDSLSNAINEKLPARIRVTSKYAVMRNAPGRAYWLFPPKGTTALADMFVYPYYRLCLTRGLHGWIEQRFVELDTLRAKPPRSVVNAVQVEAGDSWTRVEIPLQAALPFQLDEEPEGRAIVLDLYGAIARMDQVRYDYLDPVIDEIRWDQVRDLHLRLEFILDNPQSWGYEAHYEENKLVLNFKHPPEIKRSALSGRVIAIDPGHGGEHLGAIGPTRLLEKDVNLELALKLQKMLEKEGATVIMTRTDDATVGIYDRIDSAVGLGAEIILSIHNNALPDGKNPFVQRGSAVYYFHSQSGELARQVHRHLLKAGGLQDHGLYYKNLALARPTDLLAILIECAFIIHPEEEMLLENKRFQEKICHGIVEGVSNFLKQTKKRELRYREYRYIYTEQPIIKRPIWHPLTTEVQNE